MPFSVNTIAWSVNHRAFIVDKFVKGDKFVTTQCPFQRHFALGCQDPVPDGKQFDVGFPTLDKHFRL